MSTDATLEELVRALARHRLQPLRLLSAGATVARRDSHPLGDGTFPRRTN